MTEMDSEALQQELAHHRTERDKIRAIVGQIGGKTSAKWNKIFNIIFIVLVSLLFTFDLVQHFTWMPQILPSMISLELAVLLVSIKIIWMIHQQSRVEHFQFWILNSIEFRLTELARSIRELQQASKQPARPPE